LAALGIFAHQELSFAVTGKAAEFGQLKNGYTFETSTGLARM
jgi:hypothetical protein